MDQLKNLADNRLVNGCVYCGGAGETRDHVPSRVFLDSPVPENLPVISACHSCNQGFSVDEEYVACVIECALAGSTDPDRMTRAKVANILRRTASLGARIEAAKQSTDGRTFFKAETERMKNVILKLARGHAAYELAQIRREEPTLVWWCPVPLMSEDEWTNFDASHVTEMFGEIGSRSLQRLLVTQITLRAATSDESRTLNLLINDWVEVQEDRYRYLAIDDTGGVRIKIVIHEYLACEVGWTESS